MSMASQGVTANSRLAEMQMKFQKKQLLEREQKKLALTEGDLSQAPKNAIGNGKVRQMFDDRRRGVVGVDRSHPLRPITTSTTTTTVTTRSTTQQSVTNKRFVGGGYVARRPGQSTTSTRSTFKNNSPSMNGNISAFESDLDEIDNIDNESFPKEFSMLSLNHTYAMGSFVANNNEFENNNIDESSILGGTTIISRKNISKSNGIKLNPVITKKSPTTAKTTSRSPSCSSRTSAPTNTNTSSIRSPPLPNAAISTTNKNIKNTGNKTKPATFVLAVKPPPKISTPPPGMASCTHCQRHFNEDRLSKHEEVCRKMMSKKRKIFDASKHRVKGTEAETYLKKGKTLSTAATKSKMSANISPIAGKTSNGKKSNWRKTHEEFITAIREAKKVQAYIAKGGKLSDLPPPPPSENPDYIQCPHCSRRFNESAAERHIPKCANMQHNKPKPTKKRF